MNQLLLTIAVCALQVVLARLAVNEIDTHHMLPERLIAYVMTHLLLCGLAWSVLSDASEDVATLLIYYTASVLASVMRHALQAHCVVARILAVALTFIAVDLMLSPD
jgi:hypothetical protein